MSSNCARLSLSILLLALLLLVSSQTVLGQSQTPAPTPTGGTQAPTANTQAPMASTPAPTGNAQAPTAAADVVTNHSVIEMVAAQLPEEVIITKIQTSKTDFDLSTPALVELNKSGVSANIVKAMMSPKNTPVAAAPAPVVSADPNDPTAPHDAGIYIYANKKMILLEPTVYSQGKSGGVFASAMTYGIAKMKWKAVIRNQHADIQIDDPNAVFYFYFEEKSAGLSHQSFGGTSSPNEFTLLHFDVKGDTRETVVMKANAFGASSGTEDRANVSFTHTKITPGIYKVTPSAPLPPGEYGFISAMGIGAYGAGAAGASRVFDFGVGAPKQAEPATTH